MEKVNYDLCSEDCNDKWCKNMCISKKDYYKPLTQDNFCFVCCFVNRIQNENNLSNEKQVKKFFKKHKILKKLEKAEKNN